ncbi:MAG: hypothetical protein ACN6OR_12400 [Stenotrophomonas sp.]
MGFDISFYRFVGDSPKFDQMEKLKDQEDIALDAGQLLEIRRVASAILGTIPGSAPSPYQQAEEQGICIDIPLPGDPDASFEILIGFQQAHISDWHPDTSDPDTLGTLITLMAVLESLGYEAFEPQRGAFVNAASYRW